jgi:hypothetical protein
MAGTSPAIIGEGLQLGSVGKAMIATMTIEEAKAIMRRLGPEEQKFAVSISAPLYWEGPRRPMERGLHITARLFS